MKTKKFLSAILTVAIIFAHAAVVCALPAPVGTVTGESGRSYEEIALSDGTKTGVRYTQMNLSGTYGSGKILRLAECDLSNTNLSIDVLNCGSYTVSRTTVASAARSFSKNGKTVLAAINGDLWMTNVNSNTNVTKSTLQTTRGVMIIDREVWATQEFGMENYKNTSGAGTTASLKSAFGVTDKNQPLVGAPVFTVSVKNETKGSSLVADGLNRLPAWNSLVVYNHRINSMNYALNDSYEIALTTDSSAFTVDNKVTAKVSAIYPQGSTSRPTIDDSTIILTARGSRVFDLSSYQIGDTVSFDLSLIDEFGNTDLWQDVVDAIGGHMHVMVDDKQTLADTRSSEYPTSLIGIKDDGTVMFANVNASTNGTYKGLQYRHVFKLCSELGYNSVFYLDGGGSSAIVTLQNGTYTQRNYSADGSPRAVINAVAMVWNDTPVCEKQGTLSYLTTSDELSSMAPTFIPSGVIERIVSTKNQVNSYYLVHKDRLFVEPSTATIDPFMYLNMSGFSEYIDTSRYKYITLKLKTNMTLTTQFSLYFFTDAQSEIQNIKTQVAPSSNDIYVTFNMATCAGWSGLLTELRLDFFEGTTSSPGQYVEIDYIAFSASPREVAVLRSGVIPDGAMRNYYAFKDCGGEHSYTVVAQTGSASHKLECSRCGHTVSGPHIKDAGTVTSPTCTAEGSRVYKCNVCQYEMETVILPANGHTYSSEFTVDKEPTATALGEKSRHCLYCTAKTDVTVIPSLALVGDVDGNGKVNGIDANKLAKIVSGSASLPTENADLNGDGAVNSIDVQIIRRLLAGA
ncbi:MAG: phosphodiester glycosidase family protein [Clostridia bacterium]|nr:phosphodiester glycosidase family protein [Clostridia bacterium]